MMDISLMAFVVIELSCLLNGFSRTTRVSWVCLAAVTGITSCEVGRFGLTYVEI